MRSVFAILFSLMLNDVLAQPGSLYFAMTDQAVYVTGERIWVSGVSMKSVEDPEDLTVMLFDRNSRVVARQKVRTDNGKFFTGMQLNGELVSDNYVVGIAEGQAFKSFIPVMVLNPVRPPLRQLSDFRPKVEATPGTTFPVSVNKQVFGKKETVELTAGIKPGEMMMVAVVRKDGLSLFADSLFAEWQFSTDEPFHYQGPHGDVIHVFVTDADGAPAKGIEIMATLMGDPTEMTSALSGDNGEAYLHLPHHVGKVPMALMAAGDDSKKYKVRWLADDDVFSFRFDLPPLVLPRRFEGDLSDRVVNAEVYNKFRAEEKLRLQFRGLDTTDFYGKPDKRYVLDNFTRFPDMQEIIQEIIPEIRVRRAGNKGIMQVVDLPFKQFFESPALVMLDGIPVNDIDQLLKLDPLKLESVDVVSRKFFVGSLRLNGIVHYKSYKHDLAGYQPGDDMELVEHLGLELPLAPVFVPQADIRLPELSNLLFWRAPEKYMGEAIKFSSSEAEGQYEVKMVSIGRNGVSQGDRVVFTVK